MDLVKTRLQVANLPGEEVREGIGDCIKKIRRLFQGLVAQGGSHRSTVWCEPLCVRKTLPVDRPHERPYQPARLQGSIFERCLEWNRIQC